MILSRGMSPGTRENRKHSAIRLLLSLPRRRFYGSSSFIPRPAPSNRLRGRLAFALVLNLFLSVWHPQLPSNKVPTASQLASAP